MSFIALLLVACAPLVYWPSLAWSSLMAAGAIFFFFARELARSNPFSLLRSNSSFEIATIACGAMFGGLCFLEIIRWDAYSFGGIVYLVASFGALVLGVSTVPREYPIINPLTVSVIAILGVVGLVE